MDYDIEYPALQMNAQTKNPPTLAPLAPPTHSLSLPHTPPSPPLPSHIPITKDTITEPSHRPILQPVPLSKRAADHIADPVCTTPVESSEETHSYLPREIVDVTKSRQRQERAWQIRLNICASVVCNIDSTLSSFKDDNEKEEAEAVRNYLQQAIARFAGAGNAPKPPPIPVQSKPHKGNTTGNGNKNNRTQQMKKVGQTPKTPTQVENSWTTVVRNCHKKARTIAVVDLLPTTNVQGKKESLPARPQTGKMGNKKSTVFRDDRLFIRLTSDHEWRKLSPSGVRVVLEIRGSLEAKIENVDLII